MDRYLEDLNEAQREAVTHIDGSLLILAGAGTGKTKTITTRLAYLLSLGIDPSSTLTLTFTNKASTEMRGRAMSMIGYSNTPPLLATFHKFGLMFLKLYISRIGRSSNFVIIDTEDKKRIIKGISKEVTTNFVAKEISKYKNNFISPEMAFSMARDQNLALIANIYKEYEEHLQKNNLVDFDDLLLLTYKILDSDSELADEISLKYQYIMVDEYQDTNEIQLKLLKKLCSKHNNICVVGDDDQSIYGFRGASIKNILEFDQMFDAKIIKLETNYRSTSQILSVANNLISYNKGRHKKVLKSFKGDGEKVEFREFGDEKMEAESVAKNIVELVENGAHPDDIAIVYRINALSRAIEDALRNFKVAYKLIGGMQFYEREEIKDLVSYLRLIVNLNDDFSFKRVVNKPRRGIGVTSLEKLEQMKGEKSFMDFIKESDLEFLSKKASNSLKKFYNDILYLKEMENV